MSHKKGVISAIIAVAQACVLAAIVALSHGGASAGATGSINITGTVTSPSGADVANASVYATDPGGSTVEYGPSTTAADGTYELDVEAGTYDFHFDPPSGSNLNSVVDSDVTVLNNQVINEQLPLATYTLSGTVTDQNGNPIPGALVSIQSQDGKSASAYADNNGNYSVSAPADTYTQITVAATGNSPGTSYYPSRFDGSAVTSSADFDLTAGNVTQNLQLTMVALTVVAQDGNGNPMSNVEVSGTSLSGTTPPIIVGSTTPGQITSSSQVTFTGNTDSNGSYTIMVPEGTSFPNGGTTQTSSPPRNDVCIYPTGQTDCLSAPLTVSGNTTETLAEPTTYTLSGTVTDQNGNPIPGALVSIQSQDGKSASAYADNNGNYSVSAPADTYTQITVAATGNSPGTSYYPSRFDGSAVTSSADFDLTAGNVTQNLQLTMVALTVVAQDGNGNPMSNVEVSGTSLSGTTPPIIVGSTTPGQITSSSQVTFTGNTDSNGSYTIMVPEGTSFPNGGTTQTSSPPRNDVCIYPTGQTDCLSAPLTVSGNTTVTLPQPTSPSVPTNLAAPSPTQYPSLSWSASSGATSYNIYRNGTNVGSTTGTTYTDASAPEGLDSYYVTAVDGGGESSPSNTITVLVDRTPPTITYTVTPTPNSAGWNNSPVTVTFDCTDNTGGSGIASCSSPMTETTDGTYTLIGTAVDNAGNTASVNVTVNLDQTPPTVGTTSLSPNPITVGSSTTLTVPASDNLSGVAKGEYFIGSDPGQGNGTPMTYNSSTGDLTVSLGSNLSPGTYTVNFRAEDVAGNWSNVSTVSLTVNPLIPSAPTNLTAPTPTNQSPVLSWAGVSGASSYNIYRNGTVVGFSTTNNYTDTGVTTNGSYSYYVTAVNVSGESSPSNTVTVVYDTTPPTLGTASLSPNPVIAGNSTILTVPASDNLSGIAKGEYFIGSDPGQGNATPMTYNSSTGNLTASLGSNLSSGTYTINYRAEDAAGNWSTTQTVTLNVVTNQTIGYNQQGNTLDTGDANYMNGTKFTVGSVGGTATSMSAYVGPVDTAPNNEYQLSIYTVKSNGKPGALVAQTSTGTLIANSWNTLPITATLSANTQYWLMYNTNATKNGLNDLYYVSAEQGIGAYAAQTFGSWPGSFPSPTLTNNEFSLTLTYTPSSPVPPAPTTLVGDNKVESNADSDTAGTAEAFQYIATTSGNSQNLAVYLGGTSSASAVTVGLYSDNNGVPGTLLGQATITSPMDGTWNDVSLPSSVSITSGTKYWIAILSPKSDGTVGFRDQASGTGAGSISSSKANLTTLPDTWTSGTQYSTVSMSAYAY